MGLSLRKTKMSKSPVRRVRRRKALSANLTGMGHLLKKIPPRLAPTTLFAEGSPATEDRINRAHATVAQDYLVH